MRSLRTRITFMTLCVLIFSTTVFTAVSVGFIKRNEQQKSDQLLLLLCETGEKNLDYYFNSVQKSVKKVASFIASDLDGVKEENLKQHVKRVSKYFDEMAYKTNGVLTYYYRIDPALSEKVKGFWYVNLDGEGFIEHKVTDITRYDTEDTSKLVWFTVPKHEGKAIWLPPYITDNLNKRVISYNVPIYWSGTFVGVAGIEMDYSAMAQQIDSIRLYSNGYAFLSDPNGELFYHPHIDVTKQNEETKTKVPAELNSENTFFRYTYEGTEKVAAWLPLSNGMRLNVTTPVSEAEGEWHRLIFLILLADGIVFSLSALFTMFYSNRISKPLKQLTEAAEQVNNGNYDYVLTYTKDDELGKLTKTFKSLSDHVKEHISDLSHKVFVDALTHVKNRGAFFAAIEELQSEIDQDKTAVKFAIGVFDCNKLKSVNDHHGHDKGDIYLKTASRAICSVFHHSPVYRIGGDEFAVILRNEDFQNRELLVKRFQNSNDKTNAATQNEWERVNIAMGIAVYDAKTDRSVHDVIRRADGMMYEDKHAQ